MSDKGLFDFGVNCLKRIYVGSHLRRNNSIECVTVLSRMKHSPSCRRRPARPATSGPAPATCTSAAAPPSPRPSTASSSLPPHSHRYYTLHLNVNYLARSRYSFKQTATYFMTCSRGNNGHLEYEYFFFTTP